MRILGARSSLRKIGIVAPARRLDHYLCHGLAVFCSSPFDEASVLVLDGVAEAWTGALYRAERFPVPALHCLGRLAYPDSLGLVYAAVTEHLGFRHNAEEGKVMAMAALGDDRFTASFGRVFQTDGLSVFVSRDFFDFGGAWTTRRFREAFFPPRDPSEDLRQEHFALARGLQESVEAACLSLASNLLEVTGTQDLCFTGGLALNPALNGTLAARSGCRRFFAFPAGGDAGAALGAALQRDVDPAWRLNHPFWGRRATQAEIRDAISAGGYAVISQGPASSSRAASLLAGGAIGAVFRGRAEMGPRALGHRSILADPRTPSTKDRLNRTVKRRLPFQPFAPAVLEPACSEFFPDGRDSPYMLRTVPVPLGVRGRLPAVVHSDGTARVQSVRKGDASGLSDILESFGMETGLPVLLNTSLNRKGEPIADSPGDAIEIFRETELDFLLLEDLLLTREAVR